jgi:acyl carrier protein
MTTQNIVKQILINNLNLNERVREFKISSPLLGAIPELDSMAVVGIITSLEESFDFTVHDDEISANSFETFGSLVDFVEKKLNE